MAFVRQLDHLIGGGIDRVGVVAGTAKRLVDAGGTVQRIVAGAAVERVVAGAAVQQVVAAVAVEAVVSGQPEQPVGRTLRWMRRIMKLANSLPVRSMRRCRSR